MSCLLEMLEELGISGDSSLTSGSTNCSEATLSNAEDIINTAKAISVSLGFSFWEQYKTSGKVGDLDDAILYQRRAVELTSDDHFDMPMLLLNLGLFLWTRFVHFRKLDDLEDAISAQRRALKHIPEDHSTRLAQLSNLGVFLQTRFTRFGALEDLENAILLQRRAVELAPDDYPKMLTILDNLGTSLQSRFTRLGERDDIENAILTQSRVVELTPEAHPGTPARLCSLGLSLQHRFARFGMIDDLESAILKHRCAVSLTPEGHPELSIRLNNLGLSLHSRFLRLGELDDIENGISAQRRAANLTLDEHPDMPLFLNNLGAFLMNRFTRLGELDDLESAILAQCRAVDVAPDDHPNAPMWFSNLGASLMTRFERLGELDDIESAISAHHRAIELASEGNPEMPRWLNNLGTSLRSRFERLGELEDIHSAILMQHRAIDLAPVGDHDLPIWLNNVGLFLWERFVRVGELCDLESAITAQRRAIELTPEGHTNMPMFLINLGAFLERRFAHLKELDDLENAISAQHRSVELTPNDHPEMPTRLNNLGASLEIRFIRLGKLDDLERAISAQRRAVELTPEDHPDMLGRLNNLGFFMITYFDCFKDQENFDAVVKCFASAVLQTTGSPLRRLRCASRWAMMETDYPEFGSSSARLQAHSCVVDALPEVVWLGYSITRRYEESAGIANLVNSATSAAIDLRDFPQAIEWFEAGRGLIWSQVLSLRTPVDDLAQLYPDLASTLQSLLQRLQSAHLSSFPSTKNVDASASTDGHTNVHRTLVIEYEHCLKEVRACSGFEYFLRPQKFASLASSLEQIDGPVVFINVFSSRCDALVISCGGTVILVPLPELKQSRAKTLLAFCTNNLQVSNAHERGSIRWGGAKTGGFFRLLDRLWRWIVRPILDALGFMNNNHDRLPHVTWCPTGPLMKLPLHAAGLYPESGPSGPYVFEFVVSSYTPSLAALVRARGDVGRQPSVLVITQPATPDLPALPGTLKEGILLQNILSESRIRSQTFSGAQATVECIESAIGQFPWVHFACHGVQDLEDPTQSAFALHDGKLTLSTLMKTVADGAELAFLSACQTATGDEKISEESAHLAAGMLAVGFRGVVATAWSIGDGDAPIVVEAYYKKLLELRCTGAVAEGSTGAAYALHYAVKCLRESVGERNFMRWAPFVHYGV